MTQIEKHDPEQFGITTLDEAMRYAEAIAGAGLVPDAFKRSPADILVAQEIAKTMEESTWTVMSEMSIISGKPSFSAKFMRSRIRQAGHKLRESFDRETGVARAVIIRHDDPTFEHVAEWDEAKARQHGLWDKGHWKKNPELMLKNRAISEVMRESCYEVMGGVAYTPDEVQDFAPMKQQATRQDQAPQKPSPKSPSEDEWTKRLLELEASGEHGKIAANKEWAESKGFEVLASLADSVITRMERNAQQDAPTPEEAQETAQEVLDAELVPHEDRQAA